MVKYEFRSRAKESMFLNDQDNTIVYSAGISKIRVGYYPVLGINEHCYYVYNSEEDLMEDAQKLIKSMGGEETYKKVKLDYMKEGLKSKEWSYIVNKEEVEHEKQAV